PRRKHWGRLRNGPAESRIAAVRAADGVRKTPCRPRRSERLQAGRIDHYTRSCVCCGQVRGAAIMQRRINVSLSEEAVRLLDRMAPKGDRSRFLDELVKRTARDRAALRARLKEGYI